MFVLGVDPGLSRCGYCVLETRPAGARAVALGVITTAPSDPLPQRLAELQGELRSIINEFRPSVAAVERVLFQVNVRTAMSVGQASGIAMAEAATAGCEVVQYSPNQVKQAVAGHGAADKLQIQQMVQTLLGLPTLPEPPDAADAAALALTHIAIAGYPAASDPDTGGAGGRARGGRIKNGMARRAPLGAAPARPAPSFPSPTRPGVRS
jgi:crossover junction endodeoxyribonuclease RuvC